MTVAHLTGAVAVIISLIFRYFPKLREKYEVLEEYQKQLIMLGLLVLVALGAMGLSCAGHLDSFFPGLSLTCDEPGWIQLVQLLFAAVVANQATAMIAPKPKSVRLLSEN